jgi:hypothetical protein
MLAVSVCTYAGEMPNKNGEMPNVAGEMPNVTEKAGEMPNIADPITEVAINLIQSVLSLF